MKTAILFASIVIASGLIMANIYTSIVDAQSWGADIPNSIGTARDYFKTVNPGNFFRIFSPINQALALLVLLLFWKAAPGTRFYLAAAVILYMAAEALTFGYFYPRNDIMFRTAQVTDVHLLKKIWSEWNAMNWVRTCVLMMGVVLSCISLHKWYALQQH